MEATGHLLYRSGTIKGRKVMSPRGESLGEIEELVIDPQGGCVAYAVMSFGGFLGLGQKLFAVPWDALQIDEAHHDFVIDVTEEQLKEAPGFDRDNWPTRSDDTIFARQVHEYYGYPYGESR